jgi:NarL family two-component system response regulator LiaR
MIEKKPISLLIVDDHRKVHQALVEMISFCDGIEVLAHASNGQEAISLCDEYHPDIVLMDVMMPVMDGIEATRNIHAAHPEIKVLALSSFRDQGAVRAMLENGAVGYILKDSSIEDLENIIRSAYGGHNILSPEILQSLLEVPPSDKTADDIGDLSRREQEILVLFSTGLTNGEIAAQLSISISTVKFHITNILSKLGVSTRAEALVIAARSQLV